MVERLTEQAPNDDETFRILNRRFLLMAGYSEQQILDLGDLAKLRYEKMRDLVQDKTFEAARQQFKKAGVDVKSLSDADEKH